MSISKNDKIILSSFDGKNIFTIDEQIDTLEKITVWKDSIHIIINDKLVIYDKETGENIITLENQKVHIDKKYREVFLFNNLLEIQNSELAILSDENIVFIFDAEGKIVSSNDNKTIVQELKRCF